MTVVPNGWMLYTPHDIAGLAKDALVIGPFGSNLKTSDYCDEGVPLVFVKDIRAEDFSRPRAYVSTAKAAELEAHQVLPGDILITKMGDPPGDVALYDSDVPGIITADCIRLRPMAGFDRRYLVHSLRTPSARRQIDAITTGAAQQKVSLDRFRTRLHISAPPLAEQKRIAAVLDAVDALCVKRREAIALLEDLAQSIFLEMFGTPENTRWPMASFGEHVEEFRYGTSSKSAPNGNIALRIPNVIGGALDTSDLKRVPVTSDELTRLRLRAGDLLFVRSNGNPDYVGRCAAFTPEVFGQDDRGDIVYASYLIRARLSRTSMNSTYVRAFMSSVAGRGALRRKAKTSAGQYNLNIQGLASMEVPIPPMVEQERFAAIIEQVETAKKAHRTHLAVLDELFTSLQHRAFSGTLWDHEATGEAA